MIWPENYSQGYQNLWPDDGTGRHEGKPNEVSPSFLGNENVKNPANSRERVNLGVS